MFKYLNRGISTPIAIAIILLLAVSVGGITLWQYSEMQSEKIKPVALKSFEKDETADWKIYLNEEYGFEVEYPQSWKYSRKCQGHNDEIHRSLRKMGLRCIVVSLTSLKENPLCFLRR